MKQLLGNQIAPHRNIKRARFTEAPNTFNSGACAAPTATSGKNNPKEAPSALEVQRNYDPSAPTGKSASGSYTFGE